MLYMHNSTQSPIVKLLYLKTLFLKCSVLQIFTNQPSGYARFNLVTRALSSMK